MSVNINLALGPQVEKELLAAAQQRGLTVEAFLSDLIRNEISPVTTEALDRAEAFTAWAQGHRSTKLLSDEAVSRAGMYSDRG